MTPRQSAPDHFDAPDGAAESGSGSTEPPPATGTLALVKRDSRPAMVNTTPDQRAHNTRERRRLAALGAAAAGGLLSLSVALLGSYGPQQAGGGSTDRPALTSGKASQATVAAARVGDREERSASAGTLTAAPTD